MSSYIRNLITALEHEVYRQSALEIALRELEGMPPGMEKEELQDAVDRALQL